MSMFCYQCQETLGNKGCTVRGICGKDETVAKLFDMLIFILKGLSVYGTRARKLGVSDEKADIFAGEALFTTITNVNFDSDAIYDVIKKAFAKREKVKNLFLETYRKKNGADFKETVPECCTWSTDGGMDALLKKAEEIGVLSQKDEDTRSLRELIIYGAKGIAAYTDHAYVLKHKDTDILAFLQEALAATTDDSLTVNDLIPLVMKTGEYAVKAMKLLDEANTSTFGKQEITEVSTGLKKGHAILVGGHDLCDFEEILKQTDGTGINVYTHDEMLVANAYPEFKKYKHFAGHYGLSWWHQQKEFDEFKGSIIMTTNCLQKPLDSYKDRLFTTGRVGWPGVKHIADRVGDRPKDFSPLIEKALSLGPIEEKPGKKLVIGFAHDAVLSIAGKVVDAIKSGKIRRFVCMSGCDGRLPVREYHTELAKKLPEGTVILTSGCAKYRYNMLDLGDIDGIPRVLDAGQCNDSYSWAVVAIKLAEVFGAKHINDLPVSFNVAWYEQKAVCVLLALLYLGIKKIRLTPTLPAFLSPNVTKVLADQFELKLASNVDDDIAAMMAGN